MTLKENGWEGGSNGSALSTANSGTTGAGLFAVAVGSGASLAFSTARAAHGTTALRLTPASGTATYGAMSLATAGAVGVIRKCFYFTSVPTSTVGLLQIRTASGPMGSLIIHGGTGRFRARNAAHTDQVASASTDQVPVNQWITVELAVGKGTTTSDGKLGYRVYLGDSTTPWFEWTDTAQNTGVANAERAWFGSYDSASTYTTAFDMDDLAVNDAATWPAWIGPVAAAGSDTVVPTGTVSNLGEWAVTGAATVHAALADDSDATYIENPGTTLSESTVVSLGKLNDGPVTVTVRGQRPTGETGGTLKAELWQGTTVIASQPLSAADGVWADYTFALTSQQVAQITDRSALRVAIIANG